MKTLKEALFSRKNIKPQNPFGLTEEDLKGDIKDFPMGVVVRMWEEQELQGNKPDVKCFQHTKFSNKRMGGFDWSSTEAENDFWYEVIYRKDFNLFFERYPEYKKYNLS